jgi:hypothetical protein
MDLMEVWSGQIAVDCNDGRKKLEGGQLTILEEHSS